jgi:hypothetical protein
MRRQSAAKRIIVSPRDLALFRLLDRYRYLPANFLFAFVGGNPIRFKQRLGALFHEGFLNRPHRQWHALNARYRPAIYELDQKARAVLAERHLLSRQRIGAGVAFAHEVMVCMVMASIELAARSTPGLRFVAWPELAARQPDLDPDAFALPVSIMQDGPPISFHLKPDGRPFALELARAGKKRTLYFPGIELDRHTEPLAALDLQRSSLAKKILAYRDVVASEAYKTQFGFPNMLVPFVTINEQHRKNMIELVTLITKGKGASYLLFKTMRDLMSVERTIVPDDKILAAPWQRAGRNPFDILGELGA